MIANLICWFKGHKRGKRVAASTATHNVFACPRCGAQWSRKAAA